MLFLVWQNVNKIIIITYFYRKERTYLEVSGLLNVYFLVAQDKFSVQVSTHMENVS